VDTRKVIERLESLMQLDHNAVSAYKQAIEKIDIPNVREKLEEFRGDHERHIVDLDACIRRLGGTPKEISRDVKGSLIKGFTALRSVTGTEGALKAMKTNEQLTNRQYDDAMSLEMPEEVREVVEKNRDDERRHLAFIEAVIDRRVWETTGDQPSAS
jgi:uncharacterized protein (TIGR02284 family)